MDAFQVKEVDDSKFIIINHEVKEYRGLPEEETLIIPEGVRSIAPYVLRIESI